MEESTYFSEESFERGHNFIVCNRHYRSKFWSNLEVLFWDERVFD